MSYLINRRQYVKYNGICSRAQNINCIIPQGSILGPLLFLIYMHDLPNCINNSKVILFANETTLYVSPDNTVNLYDLINRDIDNLTDWFRANKLYLNTNKKNTIYSSPETGKLMHWIRIQLILMIYWHGQNTLIIFILSCPDHCMP